MLSSPKIVSKSLSASYPPLSAIVEPAEAGAKTYEGISVYRPGLSHTTESISSLSLGSASSLTAFAICENNEWLFRLIGFWSHRDRLSTYNEIRDGRERSLSQTSTDRDSSSKETYVAKMGRKSTSL